MPLPAEKDGLCKIERLIASYEMKEVTAIIELERWKSKLYQAGGNTVNRHQVQ
jgi:hypothetical protein